MANTSVVFNLVARDNLSRTLTQVSRQMERMQREVDRLNGRTATVNVRADTKGAETKLRAVGSAATSMGASLLKSAVPGMTALASAGAGVAVGVAPAVGSLALLPAVAMAGATAGGALALGLHGVGQAFKDMGDPKKFAEDIAKLAPAARQTAVAMQSLRPQFQALQQTVQQHLFAGIAGPLKSLAQDYVPMLTTQLSATADVFNTLGQRAIAFFHSASVMSDMKTTLGNVNQAARNAAPAFGSILSVFKDIGTVGSTFLPQIGTGFANAAKSANLFINNARQTGQLQQFIAGALQVLSQLGAILMNIGSAFVAVFQAGAAQGKTMLGMIVQLTSQVAQFMHSFAGQQAIQAFLQMGVTMVHQLMLTFQALAPAIAPAVQIFTIIKGTIFTLANTVIRALAPAFTMLLNAVLPIVQMLAGVFTTTVQALTPIIGQLANVFVSVLTPILRAFAGIIAQLMPVFVQIAGVLVSALVPVLRIMGQAIMSLMPFIKQLAQIFGQILLVAVKAFTPILTVVAKVMQMLAPVIGQIATMLGNFLLSAVKQIMPIIGVLAQVFMQVVRAVMPLVPILLQLIQAALRPILAVLPALMPLISTFARLFGLVVQAIAPVIGILAQALIPIIKVLAAIAVPIFKAIAAVINWALNTIVVPLLKFVVIPAIKFLASIFSWLYNTIIKPVWDAISAAISWAWNTIIKPVFNAVKNWIQKYLAPTMHWLYDHVIKPVWDWISSKISWAWNNVIKPAFEAIKTGVNHVKDTFNNVKNAIGKIWDGIKAAVAKPINFVINTVLNDGLFAAWNWIADKLGLGKDWHLHVDPIPGYASGTDRIGGGFMTNGPQAIVGEGRRSYPEYVIPTDPAYRGRAMELFGSLGTRLMAGGGTLAAAPQLSIGGAIGDAWNWVTGAAQSVWHGVSGFVGKVADFFKDPMGFAKNMLNNAISGFGGHSDSGWYQMLFKLPGQAINGMIEKVKSWFSSFGGTGDSGARSGDAAKAQAYAATQLARFGWGQGQMGPLIRLWNGESGWDAYAVNSSSGAYGIPQSLGHGHPYNLGDYITQVNWGLNYIAGRYHTPANAYGKWLSRSPHWYGDGVSGAIFDKPTLIGVGEKGRERVDVTPLRGSSSSSEPQVVINVYPREGQSEEAIAAMVERRLSLAARR